MGKKTIVETVPISNWNTVKTEVKSLPLSYIVMTTYYLGLVEVIQ